MHEDVRGSLCVFTFLACVLGTSAGAAGLRGADLVVINEVHYHPADDVRESEFVELFNDGDAAVDLAGWFLVGGVQFTFPSPTVLGPQAFILVAADATALRARYQLDAGQVREATRARSPTRESRWSSGRTPDT